MNKSHNDVWNNCLLIIRDIIPSISYKTWFEPIVPLKLENNILTIQVPSPFFYEYLEEQYIDILRKTLRKELGVGAKLEYSVVVDNSLNTNNKSYTLKLPANHNNNLKNRSIAASSFHDDSAIKNPFVIPGIQKLNIDPQIKQDNTFDN